MIQISYISTGTTVSQTAIMASLSYNLVNDWVKEAKIDPDFPVACIYDFSNMYSTIQYFATEKMLTRLNELTSILEIMKSTKGMNLDWSKGAFPSKFAHKKTKNPLFFLIPIFPRGMTSDLRKEDVIEMTKILTHIAEAIGKAKCQFVLYDLPIIDTMGTNLALIPALVNSNVIISVIDCKKPNFQAFENELNSLITFIKKTSSFTSPELSINGIVLTNINEKVKTEKWIEKIEQNYTIPIIGQIHEDPYFNTVSSKYEIPTEENHVNKLKFYGDFALATNLLKDSLSAELTRKIKGNQAEILEDKIYTS